MIATPCANESALRSYLRTEDESDRREAAISRHAENLLATCNNPAIRDNIIEAIGEIELAENGVLMRHLEKAIESFDIPDKDNLAHHAERVGMLLIDAVTGYWKAYSRREAENDINDTPACCYGQGCKRCDPQERG